MATDSSGALPPAADPDSPRKRPPIGQLEDLVWVQQPAEAAEQVSALEAPTFGVHEHEERAAIWGQLHVLRSRRAGSG